MTATSQTFTNGSSFEADAIANAINVAALAGHSVTVNGRKAKARHYTRRPADVYMNGTVEVVCEPRSRGARTGYLYVKSGQSVTVEIA